MQEADFDPHLLADVVHHGLSGFDHASGSDDGVIGIFQPVGHYNIVFAARQAGKVIHHCLERRQDAIVESALGDLALHVAVLVLHDSRHQRNSRVKQRPGALGRMPDELPHQFRLGKLHIFNRVRGEKAVLNIEKRSFGFLCGATANQGEVAGFLRVPGKQDAPAAVRHTINVIVTRMDVQGLRCERPSSNVEDNGKALARDRIENFLHQDQSLT